MSETRRPQTVFLSIYDTTRTTKLIGGRSFFLDKEDHWKGRKLKEALYIDALNPSTTTNASKIMNLEKGFELDPIWNEFNSIFRSYIREKLER